MPEDSTGAAIGDSYVELLRELVDAVYEYSWIDEEWVHISTLEGSRGRSRMYSAARKIMMEMCGSTLTDEQINQVFGWKWDA